MTTKVVSSQVVHDFIHPEKVSLKTNKYLYPRSVGFVFVKAISQYSPGVLLRCGSSWGFFFSSMVHLCTSCTSGQNVFDKIV